MRTWIVAAVLAAVGFTIYANSLSNPFVFDDGYAIVGNAHLHDLGDLRLSLTGPPGSGTSGRPLTALSLAVNYAIGGLDVTGYHIFNIAVHVLAAWALFGFVRRTLRGPRLAARFAPHADGIAFAIALLWLVHPLHTAAIDHVSYRNEVLAGFFYLLTLYGFVRACEAPHSRRWTALTIAACWLGTASKEVMGTAPLLVLLYDRTFVSGSFGTAFRRHKGTYLGLGASWILLAFLIATGDRGESVSVHIVDCTPVDYVRTQFAVVTHYLHAAFWPTRLAIDYNQPVATRLQPVLPQFLFLGVLGLATLVATVRRSPWGFLGAWFFLILSPSSSFMPLTGAITGDHRMYLPLAAPVALVVLLAHFGLDAILHAPRSRALVATSATLAVALLLAGLTVRRNRDFRDEMVLWADALAKSPGNPRAHNNLGSALVRAGQLDAAMEHFEAALRIRPNDCEARFNVGLVQLRQKQYDAAIESFRAAIQLDPRLTEAHHNLGLALLQKHDYEGAVAAFRAAIARNREHAGAHNNLAWVLATCPEPRWRDGPQAVREAGEALRLVHRDDPEMLDTLAAAYAEAGQFDAAVATVDQALALPPPAGRPDLAGKLRDRQALYRAGQPYRMPAATPP